MILYLCADLLWMTRVKSVAEDLGISARPVRSVEMLEARLADSDVRGLIVDLETGALGFELIGRMAEEGPIPVVAFGPHVATAALDTARQAGATRVLTRGAFAHRLGEILRELEADPPQA